MRPCGIKIRVFERDSRTIREVATDRGILSEEELMRALDTLDMIEPH